jgi:chorismate synthase
MNTFGKNIKLSFFGETSSPFFGLTIDGIKPGVSININKINESLNRFETTNITWKFSSGIVGGFTTGSPITIIIENNNHNIKFKNGFDNYYNN